MVTGIRTIVRRLLLLALLASAGVGWSDRASAQARAMPGTDWVPVDPALLDDLRGGFQLPSGLLVSFGIARVAWVNGELVSYLRVDIPDVARMTPAEAEALSRLAQTQLVQIGQGNVFNGADNGGLVIQNTLNGQDIRAHTTLDVSVNTLGLLQALNVGDALRNANITAPGGL